MKKKSGLLNKKAWLFGMSLLSAMVLGNTAEAGERMTLLTSFGIIQDITENVAGDRADVKVIVPVGSDPHAYNLTPANMIDMEKSDLIIINGLSFEGYLERYLSQEKYRQKIVVVSDGIEKQAFKEEHEKHHHDADHDHADHDHDADHDERYDQRTVGKCAQLLAQFRDRISYLLEYDEQHLLFVGLQRDMGQPRFEAIVNL